MLKLDEARLTQQGQISIPKKIREKLHLQTGDRIVFLEDAKGHILIQEAEAPFDLTPAEWSEFLAKTEKEPVTRVKGKSEALKHLDKLKKKS